MWLPLITSDKLAHMSGVRSTSRTLILNFLVISYCEYFFHGGGRIPYMGCFAAWYRNLANRFTDTFTLYTTFS